MQLMIFNRDRASIQTISQSASSNSTLTLIYRGVRYELPKYHSMRITENIARSIGKILTYRGMQYTITPITVPANSTVQQPQHLIYRGATYMLNVSY